MSTVKEISGTFQVQPNPEMFIPQQQILNMAPSLDHVTLISKHTNIEPYFLQPLVNAKFKDTGKPIFGDNPQDLIEIIGLLNYSKNTKEENSVNNIINTILQGINRKMLSNNEFTMRKEHETTILNHDLEQAEFISMSGIKCPKCHGNNTTAEGLQTRRSDEGTTVKVTCIDCKYKGPI